MLNVRSFGNSIESLGVGERESSLTLELFDDFELQNLHVN